MRVAIISDIHGNLPALNAVLADIDAGRPRPDQTWCLGDIVGYGADPDACAALVAKRTDVCLAGNHDLVVRGDLDLNYFAMGAAAAARWTIDVIGPETRAFLGPLQPQEQGRETGLYHASPRDPVWEYVLSTDQAHDCLELQSKRVCLIGHSHVACHFMRADTRTQGSLAYAGTTIEMTQGEWLVNPGSVGQPRDGDPRAAYMLLDTEAWTASFHRVEYPIDEAAASILEAGLPRQLAERLYLGQ
jgi:predicted phosphodiesterase